MSNRTYRVTEIVGTSPDGIDQAIRNGIDRASRTLRHLAEMADVAADRLRLRDTDLGWPLEELWVTGDLLEDRSELGAGSVVLVLDLPPEELPWLATHPAAEWVGSDLRLGKRPFLWSYRPALWPVWNHRHRRVTRFWSARSGTEAAVLDALGPLLERLVAIVAVRTGPLVLEGAVFNGDEPSSPTALGSPDRFGDSWSARATWPS